MASGTNIKKVDLTAVLHVCQTLESILKNSFGPNGLSTLLSSASGNICISNDGVALMQSIRFESPMGRMILDSIISHHRLTGDNSKSFVFIISELLCKISNKLSLSERENDIFKLRDGFTRLSTVLQTTVMKEIEKHSIFYKENEIKEACRQLVKTSIADDVDRVSKFTGVLINTNVGDVNDLSIGVLASYERIAIGTKMCVNLVPEHMVKVNQVVICAPSPGLVTEYVRAVGNAMKVLRMWTELWDLDGLHKADTCCHEYSTDESASQPVSTIQPRVFTTPGGGAAEFIVNKILNDYATRHRDNYYLALAATLFAEAVLSIPRTLHQNSFVSKSRDNWISTVTEASNNVSKGNGTISIDGKTGKLIDGFQIGLVVSLNSKMRLFTDVLELLQLLMKIDAIVI
ncbi:uncharacterized protein [Antedon mediterranea]|uniref:uncharacterized protein n=1 Tax=Antedon mediterranea TaxID=105859 RepID=UPI003AF7762C